jgi:hypothetical protein
MRNTAMNDYLHLQLTVAQAGPLLERDVRQRFGDWKFEELYRNLRSLVEERTTSEQVQLLSTLALIGRTHDQAHVLLSIIWLAKKETRDPLAREMLKQIRQTTVLHLLQKARKAVGGHIYLAGPAPTHNP